MPLICLQMKYGRVMPRNEIHPMLKAVYEHPLSLDEEKSLFHLPDDSDPLAVPMIVAVWCRGPTRGIFRVLGSTLPGVVRTTINEGKEPVF